MNEDSEPIGAILIIVGLFILFLFFFSPNVSTNQSYSAWQSVEDKLADTSVGVQRHTGDGFYAASSPQPQMSDISRLSCETHNGKYKEGGSINNGDGSVSLFTRTCTIKDKIFIEDGNGGWIYTEIFN